MRCGGESRRVHGGVGDWGLIADVVIHMPFHIGLVGNLIVRAAVGDHRKGKPGGIHRRQHGVRDEAGGLSG